MCNPELRLPFGRYAGWTIAALVRHDPRYVINLVTFDHFPQRWSALHKDLLTELREAWWPLRQPQAQPQGQQQDDPTIH